MGWPCDFGCIAIGECFDLGVQYRVVPKPNSLIQRPIAGRAWRKEETESTSALYTEPLVKERDRMMTVLKEIAKMACRPIFVIGNRLD